MGDDTSLSVARRQVTPAPTSAACAPGAAAALQFGPVQGLMIVGGSFKIERLQSGEVSADKMRIKRDLIACRGLLESSFAMSYHC
jgi:hypothetical protein